MKTSRNNKYESFGALLFLKTFVPFKTHKCSIELNVKAKCVFALSSFYMHLL